MDANSLDKKAEEDNIIEIRRIRKISQLKNEYKGLCVIKNCRGHRYFLATDYEKSPNFFTGDNDEYEWTIDIYFGGYDKEHSKYVGISFCLMNEDEVNFTAFSRLLFVVSIIDEDGKKCLTKSAFFANANCSYSSDFKNFVLKEDLLNKPKLLPNGELRIAFEMTFDSDANEIIKPSQKNQLRILGELSDSGNYADFKFIVEGKEFNVHRSILAARSPVFKAMFDSQMRESNEGKGKIVDFKAKVMEKLLRFVYVGDVEDFEKIADELLVAAEKYQIEDLKQLCEDVLAERLSLANVYDTLRLAAENAAEDLKKETIEFFHRNAKKLYEDVNFQDQLDSLPGHVKTDIICIFIKNSKI